MTSPTIRVTPAQALRQGLTLAWRGLVPLKNSPGQILGFVLQPLVMIVIFVYVFGGAAAAGDRAGVVMSAVPGVLVQAALIGTTATGLNLHTDLDNGVFDRIRSLPIARSAPLTGRIVADAVGMTISVLTALIVGWTVGFRIQTDVPRTIAAIALTVAFAMAVSCMSAYVGLIAKNAASIQFMAFGLFLPLTMGSNAYIVPEYVPGWLQGWIAVNPVSHLVSSLRGLLLGGGHADGLGTDLAWTGLWALAFVAVFAPLAVRAYKRKI